MADAARQIQSINRKLRSAEPATYASITIFGAARAGPFAPS
jgi:hypothetical protein